MKDEFLSQDGDTRECEILLRLGTKDRRKGLKLGDQVVNDLLSACTFTRRNMKGSPNFKKSLEKIERQLWRCLNG